MEEIDEWLVGNVEVPATEKRPVPREEVPGGDAARVLLRPPAEMSCELMLDSTMVSASPTAKHLDVTPTINQLSQHSVDGDEPSCVGCEGTLPDCSLVAAPELRI